MRAQSSWKNYTLELECTQYLLWGLKYVNHTYVGLYGPFGTCYFVSIRSAEVRIGQGPRPHGVPGALFGGFAVGNLRVKDFSLCIPRIARGCLRALLRLSSLHSGRRSYVKTLSFMKRTGYIPSRWGTCCPHWALLQPQVPPRCLHFGPCGG